MNWLFSWRWPWRKQRTAEKKDAGGVRADQERVLEDAAQKESAIDQLRRSRRQSKGKPAASDERAARETSYRESQD